MKIRARSAASAAGELGVERTLLGLKNREVTHNIESRHKLAAVIRVHKPNVLFVHYDDLTANLDAEMRRVANFLNIPVDDVLWPAQVESCTFAGMKARPDEIAPFENVFVGGADTFLYKGTNGRWRDVLTSEELASYHEAIAASLPPECATWLAGRTEG